MAVLNQLIIALTMVAVNVPTEPAANQGATAPELTAAFLVNFVKFTSWPVAALPADAPIVMCVAGKNSVADALQPLTATLTISRQAVVVRRLRDGSSMTECHVLYVTSNDPQQIDQVLRQTATQPILSVSDAPRFAERGGVVGFFVEHGKMRFAVNTTAAERAGLRISSKLLSLSKIVKDAPCQRPAATPPTGSC
jgi:hypothetical protein